MQHNEAKPLSQYLATRITVGTHGYHVLIDEAGGAARLIKSSSRGVTELSRFPFADNGRRDAIAGAVLTAVTLDATASEIAQLEHAAVAS